MLDPLGKIVVDDKEDVYIAPANLNARINLETHLRNFGIPFTSLQQGQEPDFIPNPIRQYIKEELGVIRITTSELWGELAEAITGLKQSTYPIVETLHAGTFEDALRIISPEGEIKSYSPPLDGTERIMVRLGLTQISSGIKK